MQACVNDRTCQSKALYGDWWSSWPSLRRERGWLSRFAELVQQGTSESSTKAVWGSTGCSEFTLLRPRDTSLSKPAFSTEATPLTPALTKPGTSSNTYHELPTYLPTYYLPTRWMGVGGCTSRVRVRSPTSGRPTLGEARGVPHLCPTWGALRARSLALSLSVARGSPVGVYFTYQ